MRHCQGCGGKLRTGRKWCYDCKTGGRLGRRLKAKRGINSEMWVIFILVAGCFYLTRHFFYKSMVVRSIIFGIIGLLVLWFGFIDIRNQTKKYKDL